MQNKQQNQLKHCSNHSNTKLTKNFLLCYNSLLNPKKDFSKKNSIQHAETETKTTSKSKSKEHKEHKKRFPFVPSSKSISPINLRKVSTYINNNKKENNRDASSPNFFSKLEEKLYGLIMGNKNKIKPDHNKLQIKKIFYNNNIRFNTKTTLNNKKHNTHKKLNNSNNSNSIHPNLSFSNNELSKLTNVKEISLIQSNNHIETNPGNQNINSAFIKTKKFPMLSSLNEIVSKKQDTSTKLKITQSKKKHSQCELNEPSPNPTQKKIEVHGRNSNEIFNISFGENNNQIEQSKHNYTKLIKQKLTPQAKLNKPKVIFQNNIFSRIFTSFPKHNDNKGSFISKTKTIPNKKPQLSITTINLINKNNKPFKRSRTNGNKDIQNSIFFSSTIETSSTSNFKHKKTKSQHKNPKPPLFLDIPVFKNNNSSSISKSIDFNSTFNLKQSSSLNLSNKIEDISSKDILKTFITSKTKTHTNNNNNNNTFTLIPVKTAFSYTNILVNKRNFNSNNNKNTKINNYKDTNYINDYSCKINKITFHRNKHNNNKSWSSLFITPQKTRNFEYVRSKSNEDYNNAKNCLCIKILSMNQNNVPLFMLVNNISLFDKKGIKFPIKHIVYNKKIVNYNRSFSKIKLPILTKGDCIKLYYLKKNNLNNIKNIIINNNDNKGINEIEIYNNNKTLLWKGNLSSKLNKIKLNQTSIELISDESEDNLIESLNNYNKQYYSVNVNKNKKHKLPSLHKSNTNSMSSKDKTHHIQALLKSIYTLKNSSSHNISKRKGKLPYIKCKTIEIQIISNHGNKHQVGLTGIVLFDKNGNSINIPQVCMRNSNIKYSHTYSTERDYLSIDNLFLAQNMTIYQKHMWCSNIKKGFPSIYINFPKKISLSEIKFYNYNQPHHLDKGARELLIIIDKSKEPINLFLHKGIGTYIIDYSQSIMFPYNSMIYSKEELEPFKHIKYASMFYEQNYETPYLPTGFIFKISLVSSWGGCQTEYISLDKVIFYDQLGREQNKYKTNAYNFNDNKFYYEEFKNYKKLENNHIDTDMNVIYFIFDKCLSVSQIKIVNHKDIMNSVSRILIHCDDKIIFNGEVNKYTQYNKGITSILFTCDLNVTKDIKEYELPGYDNNFKEEGDKDLFNGENVSMCLNEGQFNIGN